MASLTNQSKGERTKSKTPFIAAVATNVTCINGHQQQSIAYASIRTMTASTSNDAKDNGTAVNKSNNNNNDNSNNLNKVCNDPESPPDFDFNLPCAYFKSSFARSLSLSNSSSLSSFAAQPKSLDFDIKSHRSRQLMHHHHHSPPTLPTASKDFPDSLPIRNKIHLHSTTINNDNSNLINFEDQSQPPAIPARNPLPLRTSAPSSSLQQQQQLLPCRQQSTLLAAPKNPNGCATIKCSNLQSAATAATVNSNGNGECTSDGNCKFNNNDHHHQSDRRSQSSQQFHYNSSDANNGRCSSSSDNSIVNSDSGGRNGHSNRRNVWPVQSANDRCGVASVQGKNLITDDVDRQDVKLSMDNRYEIAENSTNIEAIILQNQVDTLQWQLKQVETSCEMYRAVMEEVVRFLGRYHEKSSSMNGGGGGCGTFIQLEPISRSKSMHHVNGGGGGGGGDGGGVKETVLNEVDSLPAYLRARSSTNLIDFKQQQSNSPSPQPVEKTLPTVAGANVGDHYDILSAADSYNTFKDFTWRRAPKKHNDPHPKHSSSDDSEHKLMQEAFRLSRTIHNLLNTNQPDLTQHRNSLGSGRCKNSHLYSAANNIIDDHHQHTPMPLAQPPPPPKAASAAEMLFLRTINMRDSRLSLRSSTDSSVHSTSSSSKIETDEDTTATYSPPMISKKNISNLCSATEDESGFSSISSFQEIGVPLNSTMISTSNTETQIDHDDTMASSDNNYSSEPTTLENPNSTLKAAVLQLPPPPPPPANNIIGLPLQSKTYRNNRYQRFSTLSNEDSATVLWV